MKSNWLMLELKRVGMVCSYTVWSSNSMKNQQYVCTVWLTWLGFCCNRFHNIEEKNNHHNYNTISVAKSGLLALIIAFNQAGSRPQSFHTSQNKIKTHTPSNAFSLILWPHKLSSLASLSLKAICHRTRSRTAGPTSELVYEWISELITHLLTWRT